MFKGIDFFSDTITKPTAAMKQAMVDAEVGDEQKGEDPTTLQLEAYVADLLGFEAAMFFPSATMANQIAIRLLCDRGDELLAAENCHLFFAESGGPAIHSGVMTRPIKTKTGIFSAEDLSNTFRFSKGPHYPVSKLLSIENTTNMGGGIAWEVDALDAVLSRAKELNLNTHLDGARLLNAAVKLNVKPQRITSKFNTVTLCLSKGLGCPIGAVLTFSHSDYNKVRRFKQLWGGALRQSGMLAAAGIYALKNNIERLAEDHANAEIFANKLHSEIEEIKVENNPLSTNMVFFEWHGANMTSEQFYENCVENGVRFLYLGENRFRAVTHLDVNSEDVNKAIDIIKKVVRLK